MTVVSNAADRSSTVKTRNFATVEGRQNSLVTVIKVVSVLSKGSSLTG